MIIIFIFILYPIVRPLSNVEAYSFCVMRSNISNVDLSTLIFLWLCIWGFWIIFFLLWYWFFIRGFGFSFFQFGFLVESSFFFYSKLLWLWLFSNEVNATVVSTSFSVVWLCQGDIVRWEWGFTVLENDQVEVFSIPTLFGEEFFFSNLWPLFNILFLKTVNKTKKYWNPQLKTKTDFRFPEFQNL